MFMYPLIIVIFLALLTGAGAIGFAKGSASRNPEIASLTAAIDASKQIAAAADERAAKASAQVVTVYKDRIKTIREVTPGEIQVVERVIREADPSCVLPPSFNELWDGKPAPGGQAPKDSPGTAGAPVTVAELTEATVEAKKRFDENAARLTAIQELVKAQ